MAGPYRILISETGLITPYTGYVPPDYLTDTNFVISRNFAKVRVPAVVESSSPLQDITWTNYPPIDSERFGRLQFYWDSEGDEFAAPPFYYEVPKPDGFWTNFRACKEVP